ncbi:RNA polymerase sigma factor [Christensenellaceae bacterium OttesenSCG-928-M15]|nr:RNA polymerase sigma factor [Christensenellaceae bacterium OttesenSCG-928-M15]
MEDHAIIELYFQRDEGAIAASGEKYGNYCKSIALRILENMETSDECVNDTWFRAWNAIPPERPKTLRTFFGAITRNLALNRARDLSREKRGGGQAILALDELMESIPNVSGTERVLENREITASIERWLETLTKEKRAAFILRYWHCESAAEIARRLGFTQSKTNSLLQRLRVSLKNHLEQEDVFI